MLRIVVAILVLLASLPAQTSAAPGSPSEGGRRFRLNIRIEVGEAVRSLSFPNGPVYPERFNSDFGSTYTFQTLRGHPAVVTRQGGRLEVHDGQFRDVVLSGFLTGVAGSSDEHGWLLTEAGAFVRCPTVSTTVFARRAPASLEFQAEGIPGPTATESRIDVEPRPDGLPSSRQTVARHTCGDVTFPRVTLGCDCAVLAAPSNWTIPADAYDPDGFVFIGEATQRSRTTSDDGAFSVRLLTASFTLEFEPCGFLRC